MHGRYFAVRIFVIVLFCTAQLCQASETPVAVEGSRGMVVAVSAPGAEVGCDILKRGGNAVDAAIATAFAMAVTYPPAGNIGGGGFMMIHPGQGRRPVCIDYREMAPAAATRTMFSRGDSRLGHKVVGIPGTVRGLALAHERFGSLPWCQLVLPAVELAREGFAIDKHLASSLNGVLSSDSSKRFSELRRVFAPPAGKLWQTGDRLVQPDLAKTLQAIAYDGPDAFYRGNVAKLLVAEMKLGNGLIGSADLAAYHAKIREPIHGTYRGYDVFGPPPPSSGGICLIEMLNILETFELRKRGRWSPETIHLMIETMKRAYLDRARHLGDQDFVTIPKHLTSKKYAAKLASQIDLSKATRSEDLAPEIPIANEGTSTTHFSVVDGCGMAVSNTYTLEASYGSRVVVRGAGFLLNNEMGDFNWFPGYTDRRGYIGTKANEIAPFKRMLSSQTPTIVAKNGRAVLVTGSPGGRTIINTSLNVVLNVLEFEMNLPQAIQASRLYHQWLPDLVRFEGSDDAEFAKLVQELKQRGHSIATPSRLQGDAHSILIDQERGKLIGVADRRRSGKAVGF